MLFLGGVGVNDHGALGMDTGGLVDMKDGDDSDNDSESGLNPKESTPTEVTPLKSHVVGKLQCKFKGCVYTFVRTSLSLGKNKKKRGKDSFKARSISFSKH